MINEILEVFNRGDVTDAFLFPERAKEALTAIYEIGLEVIGAAEVDHYSGTAIESLNAEEKAVRFRNELRASQRKAWAKACGVAE